MSPGEYSVEVTLAHDGINFLDKIGVSRIDVPKLYKDGGDVFDYSILTLNAPVANRTYKDLGVGPGFATGEAQPAGQERRRSL